MFRTPLKDWHRENLVLKPNLNYPDLPRMMWGDEWRGDGEIFCSFKPSRFSMLGINYDTRNPTKHLNEALLCLPCQEYLRRTIAHEFKAFHGHAIVIPFFPQQKTFSQPATFQVTLLFFPNKPMPLETKALTWHKSFFEDFAPIFFLSPTESVAPNQVFGSILAYASLSFCCGDFFFCSGHAQHRGHHERWRGLRGAWHLWWSNPYADLVEIGLSWRASVMWKWLVNLTPP